MDQPVLLRFCIEDSSIVNFESGLILAGGADPKAENSFDNPHKVIARPFEEVKIIAGNAYCLLPPLTYTVLSFTID